jgi:uncharacterized protein involved in exopolysaccharide biosynthesis
MSAVTGMREVAPAPAPGAVANRWNLWTYLALLLRRWRTIAVGVFTGGLVALVLTLVLPPMYTTEVMFAPAEPSRLSGLGNLPASLAGIGSIFAGDQQSSPFFYMALAQSREIVREVILTKYPIPDDSAKNLLEIDKVRGKTADIRINKEIKRFEKRMSVNVEREAGTVSLRVDGRTPELSAAIASAFLDAINRYNLHSRTTSAHARRVFLDGRIRDVESQLRASEDSLRVFLTVNRAYENSPILAFEYARLKRRVDGYTELYQTLRRDGELAAIDEVKDVPVINILQPPRPPTEKSWPKRRLLVIAGVGLGGLIAYAILLVNLYVQSLSAPELVGVIDLRDSWLTFRSEIRHPFRR